HVAVVYDSTVKTVTYFGDGLPLGPAIQCNVTAMATTNPFALTGGAFTIGHSKRDTPVSPFAGDMDELRFWKVARTPADIWDALKRPLSSGEVSASIVMYYSFDNFQPSTDLYLKDQGPAGYTMKMSDNLRNAPKYIPSTAPIVGGSVSTVVTRSSTGGGTGTLNLVPLANATGLTVTITANPVCVSASAASVTLASPLVMTLSDRTTAQAFSTFDASSALTLTVAAADVNTPLSNICYFTYTVSDGGAPTSAFTAWVTVNTNRKPMVGTGGGSLYCDGGDWAYAKDFSFHTPDYGDYTIEFWTYHFYSTGPVASLYSFGNNEVRDNWCTTNFGPLSATNDFCIGRFEFDQFTSGMKAEAYSSWNPATGMGNPGFLSLDISRVFEQWKHMAIVSDSATGRFSMYLNGELLGDVATYPFAGAKDGLSMCHWPFYDSHYYTGFVDEFRVFNKARNSSQIKATMYQPLSGTEPGLIGYWNFDQFADADAFGHVYPSSTWIKDLTAGGNDLSPGGCVPNKAPYCLLGTGKCIATVTPQVNCYDEDGTTQEAAGQPKLYISNAPIGGYLTPVLVEAGVSTSFSPGALDPDGDALVLKILTLPSRGVLYNSTGWPVSIGDMLAAGSSLTFQNSDVSQGGSPATSFTYSVYDGMEYADKDATVAIHVKCPIGTVLSTTLNKCVSCPHGQYQPTSGFETECLHYSNFIWSSGLGGVVTAINSALLLYVLAIAGAVIFYRDSKIIRSSSPSFCLMILTGCVFGLLDVYTYLDIPNSATCILQPLFVATGFTIAIGSLTIKTLRIHLLFNHPFVARSYQWAMRDSFLAGVSLIAVGVDFIILIVWYAVDRPRPQLLTDVGNSLYWGCSSNNSKVTTALSSTLIAYNALWLFLGIFAAVQVRNVKSAFNESQHIIPCIYILLLVSIIMLPMNYASSLFGFMVRSVFVVFLLLVGSCFVASQLFMPKIVAIRAANGKGKGKAEREAEPLRTVRTAQMTSGIGEPSDPEEESHAESVGAESQLQEQHTHDSQCLMVALCQAQIGGGILGSFSAHSLFYIASQDAIILRKYRQSVSNYYAYGKRSLKSLNETTIGLTALDGESIKIRFDSQATKDTWLAALRGSVKGKSRGRSMAQQGNVGGSGSPLARPENA
ncbi:hypothetical protein HKX48_000197, partial [Thoreauomyces humboldtii]